MPAPKLQEFLDIALAQSDRWDTQLRAQSARAAARFWQGDKDGAFDLCRTAGEFPRGFAGYTLVALSELANRCHEFGESERAVAQSWRTSHNISLLDGAEDLASRVYDQDFREERVALVRDYRVWFEQPAPDLDTLRKTLAAMPDPDNRRVYKNLASARWAGACSRISTS